MKTTRFPSFGQLRALAASHRRGHLAGGTWLTTADRDLDRIASDLNYMSRTDADWLPAAARRGTVPAPVDLDARRARAAQPTQPTRPTNDPTSHARAS